MIGDYSLFAFVDDPHDPKSLRRIPLSGDLQTDVSGLFEEEAARFFVMSLEVVAFDGGYSVDDDEVFEISNITLPAHVEAAGKNPLSPPILTAEEISSFRVKGIAALRGTGKTGMVLFQILDRSAVITKERVLLRSSDQFSRLTETGLTLGTRLCAVWKANTLRFFAFNAARRMCDLDQYFKEATDEDIAKVLKLPLFEKCDVAKVAQRTNQWMRRRFTLILKSAVLSNADPKKIQKAAKKYGVSIDIAEGRLRFPDDHAEARELLRFLSEEYYEGAISGTRFRASSKAVVSAPALE